jgi:hypothetical protein
VIPADRKYVARAAVADIITTAIQNLGMKYPEVAPEKLAKLAEATRKKREAEKKGEQFARHGLHEGAKR